MRIRSAVFATCLLIVAALSNRAAAAPTITMRLAPEIHSEDRVKAHKGAPNAIQYGPFNQAFLSTAGGIRTRVALELGTGTR
jgi:hypothetical protein